MLVDRLVMRSSVVTRCMLCGLAGIGLLFAQSASAGFATVGDMVTPRDYHTATLLLDGRVLIAGGIRPGGPTEDAELYDPSTGQFTPTENMTVPRVDHAATLLQDGRVLVVGGSSGYDDVIGDLTQPTGELYDPLLGTFTAIVSDIDVGGDRTTVTTLADGRALIIGGYIQGQGVHNRAQLFDPATNTFSATDSLSTARMTHTATLLADGRVLVTGGASPGGVLNSAEIYDPASGTFSTVVSTMSAVRERHADALLADGRVLIAGGYTIGEQLDSAELFDPVSATFQVSASTLSIKRVDFKMRTLNDGTVLVLGSYRYELPAGTAELYDPASDAFQSIEPGPATERGGLEATLLADGRVLLTGGDDLINVESGRVAYGEVYTLDRPDPIFANGFEAAPAP